MDAIHKTTARIYGTNDEEQDVEIQYSGSGSRRYIADYCKVLTPIEIEPSDLYTDLSIAIADDQHSVVAYIECEIETTQLETTTLWLTSSIELPNQSSNKKSPWTQPTRPTRPTSA